VWIIIVCEYQALRSRAQIGTQAQDVRHEPARKIVSDHALEPCSARLWIRYENVASVSEFEKFVIGGGNPDRYRVLPLLPQPFIHMGEMSKLIRKNIRQLDITLLIEGFRT
jgi:hypothetical protein